LSHNFHSSSHVIFQNFIYLSTELSQQWCAVNGLASVYHFRLVYCEVFLFSAWRNWFIQSLLYSP
jgi:hypothetical protein